MSEEIPVSTAAYIAKDHGYDQVIIIARKVGEIGKEHVTTYGVDKENCHVASRIGDFLKNKVMEWEKKPVISDSLSARSHRE